jgi:lipopolysaccharide export system protein LptA
VLLLRLKMSAYRPFRGIFRSSATQKAVLYTLATFAVTALAQEPRLDVPSSDLFPLGDPIGRHLPPARLGARSLDSQEPSILPAIPVENKISNGRTEITADEAAFDPDSHIATFRENVVLKDPTFNVVCDKLVAYLRHDQPSKSGAKTDHIASNASSAPAPKGRVNPADDPHRTLDKAIAEMHPGGRVEITQDKVETDGTVTHSIGHGEKAVYNAITGTTVLTGMPDATKGTDSVVATDEKTIITMTRDGGMSTIGPHKVIIVSKGPPTAKPASP